MQNGLTISSVRWIGRLLTEAFGASPFASAARTDAKSKCGRAVIVLSSTDEFVSSVVAVPLCRGRRVVAAGRLSAVATACHMISE